MSLVDNTVAAARLARTIVSDIALYNRDKVQAGIKNDNIFELLAKELKEGLDLYRQRLSPGVDDKSRFYDIAIVDILIKRNGNIESDIW